MNLLEYLIHHEDVRRAADGWVPRVLPTQRQAAVWSRLRVGARLTLRAVPVPVRLVWPDHGEVSVGRGDAAVTVSGPPEELALVAFGRQQVARVDYEGRPRRSNGSAAPISPSEVPVTGRLATIARPSVLRLIGAGLVSVTGDWLLAIALPIYVYTVTGSTLSSATTMTLELVAALVVGQFSGLVVDRFDRRLVLIAANVASAVLLLPLLAVHGTGQLWLVYLVSAVQSALGTLAGPAQSALIPSLVAADELVRTNTVVTTSNEVSKLIGAASGGIVLGAVGLGGVVLVDSLTFVAAALLIAPRFPTSMRPGVDASDGKGRWRRWREGLSLVRRTPQLRNCFALVVINQLAQGIALALIIAFFVQDLHRGSAAVGVFRSFQVLGTIPAGIAVAAFAAKWHPATLLTVSLVAAPVIEFFIWNGPLSPRGSGTTSSSRWPSACRAWPASSPSSRCSRPRLPANSVAASLA